MPSFGNLSLKPWAISCCKEWMNLQGIICLNPLNTCAFGPIQNHVPGSTHALRVRTRMKLNNYNDKTTFTSVLKDVVCWPPTGVEDLAVFQRSVVVVGGAGTRRDTNVSRSRKRAVHCAVGRRLLWTDCASGAHVYRYRVAGRPRRDVPSQYGQNRPVLDGGGGGRFSRDGRTRTEPRRTVFFSNFGRGHGVRTADFTVGK